VRWPRSLRDGEITWLPSTTGWRVTKSVPLFPKEQPPAAASAG
jgi:hypothetical protein